MLRLYKKLDSWREYDTLHTDREELNPGLMDAWGRVVDAKGKVIEG